MQLLPTLADFPSTSETVAQVESPNFKGITPKFKVPVTSIYMSNKVSPGNGIPGVGGFPPPIPPVGVVSAPEIMDRATFDRMTEEDRAYNLHQDAIVSSNYQNYQMQQLN